MQTRDEVETPFKIRFANHKSSFNNPNKRLSKELSKHVWCLKEAGLPFKITWKFFKQTSPYNPVSDRCNLCLWEKYFIICKPELATLNKWNEDDRLLVKLTFIYDLLQEFMKLT